jgi:hypothetical protein
MGVWERVERCKFDGVVLGISAHQIQYFKTQTTINIRGLIDNASRTKNEVYSEKKSCFVVGWSILGVISCLCVAAIGRQKTGIGMEFGVFGNTKQ